MSERQPPRDNPPGLVRLGVEHPVWDRFFQIAPLVVVGTRDEAGSFDLAPKHLALPMGWENFFGFVCTPSHTTYANAKREGTFTVSFPKPSQVLFASLAAAPRCDGQGKPSLSVLSTRPSSAVEGVLLEDAHLWLECETHKIVDGFGSNSLITGRIVEATVSEAAIRRSDKDDEELVFHAPLLAYVAPGRYAQVTETFAFPFHAGTHR